MVGDWFISTLLPGADPGKKGLEFHRGIIQNREELFSEILCIKRQERL